MTYLKVLIADDEPLMREVLASYLRQLGCINIVMAADGEQAVAIFKTEIIDIVFLDIDMPGLNGLAALKQIKEHKKNAYVVIYSGQSSLDNIEVAFAAGASQFIVKPFNPQKVVDALSNCEKMGSKFRAQMRKRQLEFNARVADKYIESAGVVGGKDTT